MITILASFDSTINIRKDQGSVPAAWSNAAASIIDGPSTSSVCTSIRQMPSLPFPLPLALGPIPPLSRQFPPLGLLRLAVLRHPHPSHPQLIPIVRQNPNAYAQQSATTPIVGMMGGSAPLSAHSHSLPSSRMVWCIK